MMNDIRFSIIVVTYKRTLELKCLLYSLLSQTYKNFDILIIHDGIDAEHENAISELLINDKIKYIQTEQRYDDWGMSLRNIGLDIVTGDFIINTNDDNYYTPNFLRELNESIKNNSECNFVYYDSIDKNFQWQNEKQQPYSLFKPLLKVCHIDMGQFAASKELIGETRFKINYDADGRFIEELKPKIKPVYIEKVLFVHN